MDKPGWRPDAELDGAESPNWIAVYKPGLTQLVNDHAKALLRIVELEALQKGTHES